MPFDINTLPIADIEFVTRFECVRCEGAGEWDELQPARSSVQISPDYKQVKCPDCDGRGHVDQETHDEQVA